MSHPNMTDTALVSVVIPAYKAEAFITDAVESIHGQHYRPIEVVVVEDCSPDGTAAVVEQLIAGMAQPGFEIRMLRQPQNSGGAAALARGFRESKGDYICWLSADDAFVGTSKLAEQVTQLAQRPGVSYGESYYVGPSAKDLAQDRLITYRWHPNRPSVDWWMRARPDARVVGLLFRSTINGSTIMVDRKTWSDVGNFDPDLRNIDQDGDMWLRFSALGVRIASIATPCGFYRIHEGQTSNLTEDCIVGTTASRLRVLMAYREAGRIGWLLGRNWPVLALAFRRQWYRLQPYAAYWTCYEGLQEVRSPIARHLLQRIRDALVAEDLIDESLARKARERAVMLYDSEEFHQFVDRLKCRA